VAGLRGFELAYDEINMHPPKKGRTAAFAAGPTLSLGLKSLCFQAHVKQSQGESGLDFVPEPSIARVYCSALIGAAPEPRRL